MLKSNTCILAIKNKKGKLMFAGDRRVSWDVSKAQVGVRPKVLKRNGVLLAGSGNAYVCDLICELMDIPEVKPNVVGFDYVHGVLFQSIVNILVEKHQYNVDTQTYAKGVHCGIFVGFRGDLFEIGISEYGIDIVPVSTPHAMGCGGDYALGSYLTTEGSGINERTRLKMALKVAALVSPGCDDNIDIVQE